MAAFPGSLQAPPGNLGVPRNHCFLVNAKFVDNQFKVRNALGRSGSRLMPHVSLSSYASLQLDSSSIRLSESVRKSIRYVPFRYNAFICRSLLPGQSNEVSVLQNVTEMSTRLYETVCRSPCALQLAPAIGVIAFAIWGLGPLLRHSRNVLLHRSDNSWKKSSTHYVVSSYLQPLLLWTGAIFICRALDPIVLPSETSQAVKLRLLNFVRALSTVLAFAFCLSSLIQQAQKFFTEANDANDTRNMGFQFAGKAVYTAVWVAALSLFMELLGFSTQRWLTAGGLGTVLLTLAGREIFTNFLSSVMIHATRPFVLNEWIQTKIEGYEVSGTVEHVGWWSPTIIRGEDREAVHIPNHKFTVNVVRNLSQKTHWRIKTHLAISHLDANKINNIVADMRKVLAKNPQVEQQRLHRRVFLDNINPENQALLILVSCFVKTSHFEEYLCVKEAILMDLLRVISHHRARLATPIRTVQKIYSDADMENIPFSEPIYSRPRAANGRPFLLIEPSYKINGEDKLKSQSRSTRRNEDPDNKPAAASVPDSKNDGKAVETSSELKADSKAASPSSDATQDPKVEPPSTSNIKGDHPAAPPSLNSKSDSKVVTKSASHSKSVVDADSNLNDSDIMESKKANPVDKQLKTSKTCSIEKEKSASSTSKLQHEVEDTSAAINSKDAKPPRAAVEKASDNLSNGHLEPGSSRAGVPPETSHTSNDNEKPSSPTSTARPPLEENIVLGVALEGSRRTLPIEEEMTSSTSSPKEEKELAASHNRNGSASAVKDDPIRPPPASDHRDQERR
ncbi:hypothetical protein Scep_001185 [Stephania cephalantha]|uniref:Uncharacterized protein n=2 Tax=Magnoliopsida TaxID=3398 RepID=A0AAP0LBA5_9MAGN